MRVLVTGHLGYIGTVMVPMLLERGEPFLKQSDDLFIRVFERRLRGFIDH